jgi:protein-L-isoaspartate(D-aspartate) O-methyltransferase
MRGWLIPPSKRPEKSKAQFDAERTAKVRWLAEHGFLGSERIKRALLKVPREDFIPDGYRDYAYEEVPLPLPGAEATVSCPHSYPLFYESLGLDAGHRCLEVGLGSGYGAALAREIVGGEGLVVSIEIDPETFAFGKQNLLKAGYYDVILVQGDGGLGYPDLAPFNRIVVTAACAEIPTPLIDQLKTNGRLIAPVFEGESQDLVLLEKTDQGIRRELKGKVLYVPLRGHHGT